jgi:hypothetical protein
MDDILTKSQELQLDLTGLGRFPTNQLETTWEKASRKTQE